MKKLRQLLRRTFPDSVVAPLRRTETYFKRLGYWASVARNIRGVAAADRRALRQSILAAPLTCARSLDEWRDPLLLADAEVDVRDVGRFHTRAHSDDLWHVAPVREAAVVEAIRSRLRPGDTFVDAGANIGFYSVLAARIVGDAGRVVAFEMMPDTAAVLRRHIELNHLSNVTVIEHALADAADRTLDAHVIEGKFGQASISPDKSGRLVSVRTTTLNDALRDIPRVAVMKMDIEGAEEQALRGAEQVLDRVENIIFESWGQQTAVDDFLAARGFSVSALDGRNRLASRS
jgi:FkbM family methyltransferase